MSNFALAMEIKNITIEEYNYPLPDERIAQHPIAQRDKCKLLVRYADGRLQDRCFDELPTLLPGDTMLIYNNTRVINARVRMHKDTGAAIEIFCLDPTRPCDYEQAFASTGECEWSCFVGNSKRWKSGLLSMDVHLQDRDFTLTAERTAKDDHGSRVLFRWDDPRVTFSQIIEAIGEIPIPPYLNRATERTDLQDYQTVFSRIEGSVAAPTAGLHFTPQLLQAIDQKGMARREITLHVGAGTFQPVKTSTIGDHTMHSEFISVSRELIEELAKGERKVVAVGTTSVRTLESLYHLGCMVWQHLDTDEVPQWYPYMDTHPRLSRREALEALARHLADGGEDRLVASTRIIIGPGYDFKVVDGMITNFHQPQSTLLLLVSAFTRGDWRAMYDHALAGDYRFLSYGDAQLLMR